MIQAYLANGDTGALDVWRQVKYYLLDLDKTLATGARLDDRESLLAE